MDVKCGLWISEDNWISLPHFLQVARHKLIKTIDSMITFCGFLRGFDTGIVQVLRVLFKGIYSSPGFWKLKVFEKISILCHLFGTIPASTQGVNYEIPFFSVRHGWS